MKHGKNCGFFAPQKSIRWRSELVFGLKESILAQLSPWSAKWHQDSLQVSENVANFSKVNEAAAAYMVIAEGLKWLTKFSAWCCLAYDLTYALDDRSCRRKITRLADSSERPTPGLSVFLLFVWASMCSVWNDTNVWGQNQWVAFVHWVQSKVKTCDHSSFNHWRWLRTTRTGSLEHSTSTAYVQSCRRNSQHPSNKIFRIKQCICFAVLPAPNILFSFNKGLK